MRASVRSVSGVVLATAAVLTGIALAAPAPEKNQAVRQLLAQRLATVTKLNEEVSERFVGGKVSVIDLLDVQASLLAAELALAETRVERAKIYETHIDVASQTSKKINEVIQVNREAISEGATS